MTDSRSPNSEGRFARASLENMYRVFTVPEEPDSTLGQIDQRISRNLSGFLQEHIVAIEKDLAEVEAVFANAQIPEHPAFVSDHTRFLLDQLVAHSVHTASPSFIGHMTSALPYFMIPLSKIMIALNQNLVKTETSKAFTPLERQVLGMMHNLVYRRDDAFYAANIHASDKALGSMCSGGTIANVTALWVARNRAFPERAGFRGVRREGLHRALRVWGYDDAAILVSERGHYSLKKAADLLGLGSDQVIAVETDGRNRIRIDALKARLAECEDRKCKVLAIIGVAGTTETGSVDPLAALADLCEARGIHFHVDAAWGGPTLFSDRHRHLLDGIDRADSVTLDAHKQLYVPMGAGMVVFRDPDLSSGIEHHAQYIIRRGSRDLGSKTLEGSRPGMAMLVHAGLHVIGRSGYELLIDLGIEKARTFAELINNDDEFELVSAPELNILTYRYAPLRYRRALAKRPASEIEAINALLSRWTKSIQKTQRNRGKAFVSRTRLNPEKYGGQPCIVFRCVLANPLTTPEILQAVLEEQKRIAQEDFLAHLPAELDALTAPLHSGVA